MTGKEALAILEELDKMGYKPNPWEERFLPSLKKWLRPGNDPSEKQAKVLQKIYKEATEIKSVNGETLREES